MRLFKHVRDTLLEKCIKLTQLKQAFSAVGVVCSFMTSSAVISSIYRVVTSAKAIKSNVI